MKFNVTNELKRKALKWANEIEYNKSEIDKKNIENTNQYSKVIGKLGELIFEEYLNSKNLFFSTDEIKIINYLFNKKNLMNQFLKFDMGDYFCSKSQKSIDIKASALKNKKTLLSKSLFDKIRPVDYFVAIQFYPEIESIKEFNIENIKTAKIVGISESSKFKKSHNDDKKMYVYYKDLDDISIIDKEFYTINKKPASKTKLIYSDLNYDFLKDSGNLFFNLLPDSKEYLTGKNKWAKKDNSHLFYDNHNQYSIVEIDNMIIYSSNSIIIKNKPIVDLRFFIRDLFKANAYAESLNKYILLDYNDLLKLISIDDFEFLTQYFLEMNRLVFLK